MKYRNSSNDRGAALLFAMGLLALFLALSLAFAGSMLLQRKIAANRASRTATETIAESAINHVKTLIFLDQSAKVTDWNSNFDIRYLRPLAGHDDAVEIGAGETHAETLADIRKEPPATSEWRVFKSGRYNDSAFIDWHTFCPAGMGHTTPNCSSCDSLNYYWRLQRVTDTSEGTPVERIVGRYTYLMVPDWPRERMLNSDNEMIARNSLEDVWLRDRNYLGYRNNLTAFWTKFITDGREPRLLFDNGEFYKSTDLEAYYSYSGNSGPRVTDLMQRFNLRRGAADESVTIDGQAYTAKGWNSLTPAMLLDHQGTSFFNVNGDGDGLVYDGKFPEINTAAPDSIPFLARIADVAGTFGNLGDRRLQIAANLIDYNDGNDTPTSNVVNTDWRDMAKAEPVYTGNERTLYIDRAGVALLVDTEIIPHGPTDFGFKCTLKTAALGGLVDIYSNSVKDDYVLHMFGGANFTGTVDWNCYVSYQYKETPEGGTLEDTFFCAGSTSGTLTGTPAADSWAAINFYAGAGGQPEMNDGYTVAGKSWSDAAATFSVNSMMFDGQGPTFDLFTARLGGGQVIGTSLKTVFVEVNFKPSRIDFNLKRMVLACQTPDDGRVNVDFVKNLGAMQYTFPGNLSLSTAQWRENASPQLSCSRGLVGGGVFAKDPRQNLNAQDWYVTPVCYTYRHDADQTEALNNIAAMMGTMNGLSTEIAPLMSSGQFNCKGAKVLGFTLAKQDGSETYAFNDRNSSNPYGGHSVNRDIERVDNPGWVSDSVHLSTGFFRNAPMESLAELGFIHRGAMWETINLGQASAPGGGELTPDTYATATAYTTSGGTSYSAGDGALLDQVMARKTLSELDSDGVPENMQLRRFFGNRNLYDLNQRDGGNAYDPNDNGPFQFNQMLSLISLGALQSSDDVGDITDPDLGWSLEKAPNAIGGSLNEALINLLNWKNNGFVDEYYINRAQFLSFATGQGSWSSAVLGRLDLGNSLLYDKALIDELNAKLMEHAAARVQPNIYRVLVVAQSIHDIGGYVSPGLTLSKTGDDGDTITQSGVMVGNYDAGWDEITGQLRVLYVLERDPLTGKVTVIDATVLDN